MPPPRRAAALSAASNMAASAAAGTNRTVSGSASANNKNKDQNEKESSKGASNSTSNPSSSSLKPPAPLILLSPIVVRLRQMWKFAAICQFLFTFDEAFGFSGFETDALESDLDGTETRVIPDLFRRLLYTLTLNRNIDESNWEDHLRKQYLSREPEEPLLGTVEEPLPWHGLSLEKKVESIHTTCEWQLWDAEKFRKLVKNEEDAEVWRIDPIGWDGEDNTYWLFDDNRLWIQHPPPPPPPTAKAKAPPKKTSKKAKAEARREAQKRKRETDTSTATSNLNTPAKSSRSTPNKFANRLPRTPPTRSSPRNRMANGESNAKQPRSTRSSRRTDEWEQIPAELLYGGDSDLSDPSEEGDTMDVDESTADSVIKVEREEVEEEEMKEGETDEKVEEKVVSENNIDEKVINEEDAEEKPEIDIDAEAATNGPVKEEAEAEVKKEEDAKPKWIEFEAICITRQEWEWMSTRFAKSKHPDEKALHQLLKETVLPKVIADLDEVDKQRAHELAMANRKRSSRIALKESEREERERDKIARQKMEEKMSAIRAEEDEKVRKEEEEVNLAKLREERLREREERAMAREREAIERAQREIDEREERERMRELRKLKREQIIANGGQPPEDDNLLDDQMNDENATAAADDESWELDCEVCGRSGINLDDTDEIVCCEQCGKWQHTNCWNAFDRRVGRKVRDWENEDFFCSRCRPPAPGQPRPEPPRFTSFANDQSQKADQTKQSLNPPTVPSQASTQSPYTQHPSAAAYNHPNQGMPQYPSQGQHLYPAYNYSNQGMSQHPPSLPYQMPPNANYRPQPNYNHHPQMAQMQQLPSHPQMAQMQQFPPHPQFIQSSRPPAMEPSGPMQQRIPPTNVGQQNNEGYQRDRINVAKSPIQTSQMPVQNPTKNIAAPQQNQIQSSHQAQAVQRPQPNQSVPSVSQSPPQMAQVSPKPISVPVSNGMMGAPRQIPSMDNKNSQSSNALPNNGITSQNSTSVTPLRPSPKESTSNGSPAALSRTSPGYMNANGSPGYGGQQAGLPVRSPGSINGTTNPMPRNISGPPSGSFPLRHTPARSPLSGPHHISTSFMPTVSIGAPVRSGSPSPNRPQSQQQSNVLTSGRSSQLENELLHGRQPSISSNAGSDYRSTAPSPSSQINSGPGPSTGSLARPTPQQAQSSPNPPSTSLPSMSKTNESQRTVGQPPSNQQPSVMPSSQSSSVGYPSKPEDNFKGPSNPSNTSIPAQQQSISSYPSLPPITSKPVAQTAISSNPSSITTTTNTASTMPTSNNTSSNPQPPQN